MAPLGTTLAAEDKWPSVNAARPIPARPSLWTGELTWLEARTVYNCLKQSSRTTAPRVSSGRDRGQNAAKNEPEIKLPFFVLNLL